MAWNKQYQPSTEAKFTQAGWEPVYHQRPAHNSCLPDAIMLIVVLIVIGLIVAGIVL
jgi:hypothetical protein